ncbi:MAG: hypothetical protein REI12_02265 [Pedobacter sp.]|nr:hypothetical protein [Pedobacter sp.]
MSRQRWIFLSLFLLLGAALLLGFWLRGEGGASPAFTASAQGEKPAANTMTSALPPLQPLPVQTAGPDVSLPELPATTTPAAESMGNAREYGDARQPALQRDAPREAPTAAELADPAAYQRYEARQNQRLHRAYVKAADAEIPRLQQDIAQARAQGMTPEQIAEGEEKLRRIQAMRDQLQAEGNSAP